jgi:predicted outer membrane protein
MMGSRLKARLISTGFVAASIAIVACQKDAVRGQPPRVAATSGKAQLRGDSASGDVTGEAAPGTTGRWLTDANVLSMLSTMTGKQIAGADVELQAWHSDTVRAFAASVARDQAAVQHSVDSLASRLRMTPVAPALEETLNTELDAALDALKQVRGASLDRAFVSEQITTDSLLSDYAEQLAAVAERPEVQALSTSVASQTASQLIRARSLLARFAMADSLTAAASADSAAKRAARRKR